MLQIWRLVFIRGSWFTTTMAVLYWVDWATVQYYHCWIYCRPTTEEKLHCPHAIQHAKEERSICERDSATQGEANDYVDILISVWGTDWTLRLILDLPILLYLGTFLLRGLANSIPLAILGRLRCFYDATVLWTKAILRSQHRSEVFAIELFTSYPTLFATRWCPFSILYLCLRGGWNLQTCVPRLVWVKHFFEYAQFDYSP